MFEVFAQFSLLPTLNLIQYACIPQCNCYRLSYIQCPHHHGSDVDVKSTFFVELEARHYNGKNGIHMYIECLISIHFHNTYVCIWKWMRLTAVYIFLFKNFLVTGPVFIFA